MKSIFKILLGAGLAVTVVSCGSTDPYYGNNGGYGYPNGGNYPSNVRVYRTADGQVYRAGEVYRDYNGNVWQNGQIIRRGDVYGRPGIISRSGNYGYQYPRTNLPPGQAKKVYGGKAKDYAPGQVKKRNGYYDRNGRWYDRENDQGENNGNGKYKKYKKYKDRYDD